MKVEEVMKKIEEYQEAKDCVTPPRKVVSGLHRKATELADAIANGAGDEVIERKMLDAIIYSLGGLQYQNAKNVWDRLEALVEDAARPEKTFGNPLL